VNAAVAQGYAVLNIDKLGTGYSSRPPTAALGSQQDVFALHQIVASVKQAGFAPAILTGCLAASASPCELGLDVGRRF
jgi:alpha-beta hydrolase superfamily lysophospholipase